MLEWDQYLPAVAIPSPSSRRTGAVSTGAGRALKKRGAMAGRGRRRERPVGLAGAMRFFGGAVGCGAALASPYRGSRAFEDVLGGYRQARRPMQAMSKALSRFRCRSQRRRAAVTAVDWWVSALGAHVCGRTFGFGHMEKGSRRTLYDRIGARW